MILSVKDIAEEYNILEKDLEESSVCPVCNEALSYFHPVKGILNKECKCSRKRKIQIRIQNLKKLSIFDKNSDKNTFDNADYKNVKSAKYGKQFKNYCDRFEKALEVGKGIIMMGNAGTGKTYFSNCIKNEIEKKGYTTLNFNISKYFQHIKKGFEDKKDNEEKFLEIINEVDLLIIDDLGSEKISEEWGMERIFNLLDTRYRSGKPLIVTTNLNDSDLFSHLEFRKSDKIGDRLLEMCKPFDFDWDSRRGKDNSINLFD